MLHRAYGGPMDFGDLNQSHGYIANPWIFYHHLLSPFSVAEINDLYVRTVFCFIAARLTDITGYFRKLCLDLRQ